MDTSTIPTPQNPEQPGPGAPPTTDPRDRATGMAPDAPAAARDAARGHELNGQSERSAVGFLLGAQRAPRYKVPVTFATDEGDVKLWFYIRSMDSKNIDKIEESQTDRTAVTATGMPKVDDLRINAYLVAEACISISDGEPGTSAFEVGAVTKPTEPDFLAGNASAGEALLQRFHFQGGLLAGVANQIRRISGWAPDRVGQAERVLVDTAGGS